MQLSRSLISFALSLSLQLTRAQQRSVRRRHQRATFVSLGPSATRILRTCGESQRHATAFQGPDALFFREPEGLRNTGVCLMACIWCRVFCRPASCEFLLFLALILKADKVYAISLWYITVHRRGCVLYGMRCSKWSLFDCPSLCLPISFLSSSSLSCFLLALQPLLWYLSLIFSEAYD